MRFDLITIFPQFFQALELSLLGKAQDKGLLDVQVHDLRDWTSDPHRTVDDTPAGGGAGMVMRADIWGLAIDDMLKTPVAGAGSGEGAGRRVLAVPTPSGELLTQAKAEELAQASQIIIACGRYEGIDARVGQHYADQPGVEVWEYSIGDYVLNGGEAAALVLIEAVSRLLPQVIGNPESLAEESHGPQGLLEYPAYTKPASWRGLDTPGVLLGGDHAKIADYRREQSLLRTVLRRPDLATKLDPQVLSTRDKEILARQGLVFATGPQELVMQELVPGQEEQIAALAAETFPMACPSFIPPEEIAKFIATELNPLEFAKRLENQADNLLWGAYLAGQLVGYSWVQLLQAGQIHPDPMVAQKCLPGSVYLSKCYVRQSVHGTGIAGALLEETIDQVRQRLPQCPAMALGTNSENIRAQRFYKKHGFKLVGKRVFYVGEVKNYDVVMRRDFLADGGQA